jgi:iron complex outermembrane receptor protein
MRIMTPAIRCLTIGGVLLWGPVASADPPPAEPTDSDTAGQAAPTEEIVVKAPRRGYRSDNVSNVGPFKGLRLQDTPYSIDITPGALIENRAAHTVSDALLTDPAVATLSESNSFSSASRVMIRGFSAGDQGDLRDGIVDRSFTYVPLENVARIEVQNGLSSFLYGFGAVGGTINYVSKQPSANLRADVTVGDYGGGINYGQVGLTGPLTEDKALTGRVDLYREDGSTTIDNGAQNRTFGAGVLNYRFDKDTVVKLDFLHQDYTVAGLATYFSPAYFAGKAYIPPAPDPSRQYGQPYTHNQSERDLVGGEVETPLSDDFKLRAAYRYGDAWRRFNYIDAEFSRLPGIYRETYVDTPEQHEQTHAGYVLVETQFATWSVKHFLTFGVTASYFDFRRGPNRDRFIGLSSISDPVYIPPPFHVPLDADRTDQNQLLTNFLVGDRVVFDSQWSALIGANYAGLDQGAGGHAPGITGANFSRSLPSPGLSLIYKPIPSLSLYATYMQGLETGGMAPAVATFNNVTKPVPNAGQILSPEVDDQYEVGAKATVGSMFLTAALFRIDKVNEAVDQTDFAYRQEGREVHEGLEVTAAGKLTGRLTAVGGFTVMQARIDNAPQNSQLNGKIPVNVPERQARAYFEYLIPELDGLTGSLGVNYFGARPVDSLNTGFLPDAVTVDLGMRYQTVLFGQDTTFNVRVTNLLDTAYWSYIRIGDGILEGTPRTVAGFMKVSF